LSSDSPSKFLSSKTVIKSSEEEQHKEEISPKVKKEVETSLPSIEVEDNNNKQLDITVDTPTEKSILIAKKFLIEKRVLAKVLDNLNYTFTVLENNDKLEDELQTGKYDVLIADENMISDKLSQSYSNLAIITSSNSKDEISKLIKKHRG